MKFPCPTIVALCLAGTATILSAQTAPAQSASTASDNKDQVVTLEQFNVTSDTEGYRASTSTGVSRLKTPIKEIPQTVNIVTSDFLADTYAFNIGDAVRYLPNVATRTENHQPTTLLIRGFINTATYFDSFHVFEADIDLAAVAQIEIIKGPASATFGRGEPGGAVNYVTKVPLATRRQSLDVTIGSYDFYRATVDATGPLNESKSMRYRIIATWQESDSWQDFSHTRKRVIVPSFRWDLGKDTQLNVTSQYSYIKSPQNSGVVYLTSAFTSNPKGLPETLTSRSFNTGEPFDRRDDEYYFVQAALLHKFNDHLSLRESLYYGGRHRYFKWPLTSSAVTFAPNRDILIGRSYRETWEDRKTFSSQADLVAKYSFLTGKHQTLFGYEYIHQFPITTYMLNGSLAALDYMNPVYGARPTNLTPDVNASSVVFGETIGAFVEQQSSFFNDRLKLSVGVRRDAAKSSTHFTNGTPGRDTQTPYGRPTDSPRVGITYTIVPQVTVYAIRSQDKEKPFTIPAYNSLAPTDPRINEKLSGASNATLDEYGFKAELLQGRLSLTASHYRLLQNDAQLSINVVDSTNGGKAYNKFYLSDGQIAKGIELQAFGKITDRLDVISSFSKTQATNHIASGLVYVPGIPDNQFSAYLKYRFSAAGKDGLSIRGGYIRYGGMWGQANDLWKFGPQGKGDVGATYTWGRYRFDLAINNVTDVYFIDVATSTNVNPSPPRQVFGSVEVRF